MSLFRSLFGKSAGRIVRIEPSGRTFAITSGETVLERALKEGVAYPHDCTVGTCGTCRSKLLSGKVEAVTPFSYTLSKEELEAGYILACQALAKSDLTLEVTVATGAVAVAETRQARLVGIDDLTHDIKRVRWAIDKPMHYRAGQYMSVQWGVDGCSRSYSFATAPHAGGLLEVSTYIRHVPGGKFTDMLFNGDLGACAFALNGPHGNFWLREGSGPILCIAGGSGLAPIVSLLQDAASRKVRRDCILLFGARQMRDLYAADEIARIRNAWTASFSYWPILSEQSADGYRQGFVTAHIPDALASLGGSVHGYMCGPPAMIDAGVEALVEAGVGLDDIHYDKFTDASTRS
jgi:p-cymene monooxygenase electron transfer component